MADSLTPEATKKLDSFLEGNPSERHPDDMKRWHAFVIQAHKDGLPDDDAAVRKAIERRWAGAAVARWTGRYVDARALLAAYDAAP